MEIIGIIPAAGYANRIKPIPCSKEILPIGIHLENERLLNRPKVACSYLLESMAAAGAQTAFFVLRNDKCDIISFLGSGSAYGLRLAYLAIESSPSAPCTINQAFPFVQNKSVLFGFPDILLKPKDTFIHLLKRQSETGADIVLGLFKVTNPSKVDVVEIDSKNRITGIYPKSKDKKLPYTWLIATWSSKFTNFLNHFILEYYRNDMHQLHTDRDRKELFVGDVIQAAIDNGMEAQSVVFERGSYLDIGTPEDLEQAFKHNF